MANESNHATNAMRARWESRYQEGTTPWDTQITPPEVVAFWQEKLLPPQGVALDLGCGPGTNVRFLAALGLTAIGIEIASAPLLTALQRFAFLSDTIRSHIHFVCGDVTLLPFLSIQATYILDIGCLHSLPPAARAAYADGVATNLAPGGYYHLFAFDAEPENPDPTSGPPGMSPGEIAERFSPHLTLIEEIIARPDRRPCRWYLLQRPL